MLHFNRDVVGGQLRSCGIIDSLRVYAAGRPCHVSYELARERYGPLLAAHASQGADQKGAVESMLRAVLGATSDFLCGATMAFLTEKQLQQLDDSLDAAYTVRAVKIQVRLQNGLHQARLTQEEAPRGSHRQGVLTAKGFSPPLSTQAWYRARVARRKYLEKRSAVSVLQRSFRRYRRREKLRTAGMFKSALCHVV